MTQYTRDYEKEEASRRSFIWRLVVRSVGGLAVVLLAAMWGCPKYYVYERTLAGKAELAQAESNRNIKTLEAQAAQESAKHLAQAEIERAKGVAEANRIIGESLRNNEDYLRYLWIHNLELAQGAGTQVIYVPTEANLPILEASRARSTETVVK